MFSNNKNSITILTTWHNNFPENFPFLCHFCVFSSSFSTVSLFLWLESFNFCNQKFNYSMHVGFVNLFQHLKKTSTAYCWIWTKRKEKERKNNNILAALYPKKTKKNTKIATLYLSPCFCCCCYLNKYRKRDKNEAIPYSLLKINKKRI